MLGGGPSGAAASRLLASWGHRVRLITRAPGGARLGVSLPPSCAKVFDAIGVADVVDQAGFVRSTGNTVWWGGAETRVEMFAGGSQGWQVDLARLEAVLLDAAARQGVEIVRQALPIDRYDLDGRAFVLDCTGRTGIIARAMNARRYHDGPKTIALVGEWRGPFRELEHASHTAIESYADGWMWSVPVADGVRHVSAMIDPQRSALARGGAPRDIYLAEIAKTTAFRKLLADASMIAGPSGWDASTYFSESYCGDGWLLVGDAASFIDPLSSAGVKKALASAWLGAVVVNTSIRSPAMRAHANDFYAEREREIERRYAAESRAFLAGAARGHDRPFWEERSRDRGEPADDAAPVRRALEELRRADGLQVTVAADVRIEQRPVVEGNELCLAGHVVAGQSAAVRYVNNVDVVTLLELAPHASQVPDLFDSYVRRCGGVSLHDFLVAFSTAVARGWLVRQ